MFRVLLKSFKIFGKWAFNEASAKFAAVAGMFGLLALLIPVFLGLLPSWFNADSLTSGLSAIPPGAWFFIDVLNLQYGVGLVFTALATRFIIRRIPFLN